jgi:hypothetical protein
VNAARARRLALLTLGRIAVAIFAALLLAAPVAHDVTDHPQSAAHCHMCTGRPQAVRAEPSISAPAPPPDAAGDVVAGPLVSAAAPTPFRTPGRSPPA